MEKLENWEHCKIYDEMQCRSKEKLCNSILKGLARRKREKHAMLADVEERREQDIKCIDDITGKELPWHAVRKARELELKYLRDLGCMKESMRRRLWQNTGSLQWTKWIDTDKEFEGEPMQIRSRKCAREFKSDYRPDLKP